RPVRETGRRARSLPASQCFPRDLELVGLPTERPLQLADLAAQLPIALALFLAGQALPPGLQQLIAPARVERQDRVLTAHLPDAAIAAQAGQHSLQLLLRRPTPVLPLLA